MRALLVWLRFLMVSAPPKQYYVLTSIMLGGFSLLLAAVLTGLISPLTFVVGTLALVVGLVAGAAPVLSYLYERQRYSDDHLAVRFPESIHH